MHTHRETERVEGMKRIEEERGKGRSNMVRKLERERGKVPMSGEGQGGGVNTASVSRFLYKQQAVVYTPFLFSSESFFDYS